MFKKFLIVASKLDKAGINITTQLSQFGNYKFYLRDEEIISDDNLNHEKINQFDFIIFASKHKSEKKEKTISVHAPGNFRIAEFGGKNEKLCKTSALFQKQLFEKLHEIAGEHHLKNYKITLECTHHGPLVEKPCLFVEIGSTETEWNDKKAGFVVAKAISDTIKDFKINPYNEIAIGIGGPHYCPGFNKIQLDSNVALSHIIPQYVFPLKEEIIKEAINKTVEEIDFVLLDWKGLGNSEHKQELIKTLDNLHLVYKRTDKLSQPDFDDDEEEEFDEENE